MALLIQRHALGVGLIGLLGDSREWVRGSGLGWFGRAPGQRNGEVDNPKQ
jgi:hypothetical protein